MTFREDQGKEEPDAEEMFEEPAKKKRRGAYFKEINMRTLLRKTRAKVSGYRIPDALELTTRQKANELIKNPNWVNEAMRKIHGGENAAEGHGEAIDDEEAVSDDGADRADDDVDEDD